MAKGIYAVEAEKYTVVEYIESSGTQYIDTGFMPNNLSSCEIIMSYTSIASKAIGLFGAAGSGYTDRTFESYYENSTQINIGFGTYEFVNAAISAGQILSFYIGQDKKELSINNEIVYSSAPESQSFTCPTTFVIHALNRNGTIGYQSNSRLYSCKLWDDDVLVRDFVPAIAPDGSIGLLDKLTNTFYGNAGTGVFTAGEAVEEIETGKLSKKVKKLYVTENIEENAKIEYVDVDGAKYYEVEYIESSGTQYIDTGFNPNNNTRLVMDAQMTNATAQASVYIFFGCRGDGNFFELYKTSSSNWNLTFLWNTTYPEHFTIDYAARHTVEINKNTATVDGETITYTDGEFQLNYPIYLGADNNAGTATSITAMKIYSCQVYDNDVLVRDFIPVVTEDGVGGLFDKVSSVFYQNAGTGVFTTGEFKTTDEIVIVGQKSSKIEKGYVIEEKEVSLSPLPEGYTVYEYIESSGTQYIDTGFKPTYASRVVAEVSDVQSPSFVFGVRNGAGGANQFSFYRNAETTIRSDYFGPTSVSADITDTSTKVIIDKNANVVNAYGVTITNTAVTGGTSALPLWLFALNDSDTVTLPATMKLYSCQIYDNDALIRNFIPCLSPDSEIGLYDTVNSVFYANSGTGAFTAGAEVEYGTGIIKIASTCYTLNTFESYTGTYTVSEVTGTDGVLYNLYTLTGSGTLTLMDDVQYWMCGGGAGGFYSGNKGDGQYIRDASFFKAGGGGGGGYFATGTLNSGKFVVTIGAGGGSSSRGATTTITENDTAVATSTGGLAGSTYQGGNGASGGGGGAYFSGTFSQINSGSTYSGSSGTSGGLSTYPFGIESLYAHCPGGGGGSHLNAAQTNNLKTGGSGGSNGVRGSVRNSNGGARGGGNGTKFSASAAASTITEATSGSFYGAGGGGAGFRYYSSTSYWYSAPGKAGYQGVMYLLIPA